MAAVLAAAASRVLSAALIGLACLAPVAIADTAKPAAANSEMWVGADAANDVWLLYSGSTLAPFGSVQADGFLLRAAGGYGQYAYSGQRRGTLRRFRAAFGFAEALAGYQKRIGPLTAKAFVGIAAIDHTISPEDPVALGGLLMQGTDYGVKGVLELWLNLGTDGWASLDSSWTSAHQTYSSRLRVGYRVSAPFSIGLEATLNGNALDAPDILADGSLREKLEPSYRLGVFARREWQSGEISISAGVARNGLDFEGDVGFEDLYGTVNWLTRF